MITAEKGSRTKEYRNVVRSESPIGEGWNTPFGIAVQSRYRYYFCSVQRLYSMFPAGLPGIGLIALRVTVGAMLLVDGSPYAAPQCMAYAISSSVAAACLVIGILTPYAAAFAGCLEFWRLCTRDNVDLFHLIAAIFVSLALAVLGPGAYSVDNKIFGRRLVNLPHGSEGNSSTFEEVE
jgi:uncharacterized membrane protein YphA (DoxX/SURF4 family)